jgi:hypothetical protein
MLRIVSFELAVRTRFDRVCRCLTVLGSGDEKRVKSTLVSSRLSNVKHTVCVLFMQWHCNSGKWHSSV